MSPYIFILFLLCIAFCSPEPRSKPYSFPKNTETNVMSVDYSKIYTIVDEMPRFSGCKNAENVKTCSDKKLLNYFYSKFEMNQNNENGDLEYKVVVRFVVEKDGSISNVHFLKGKRTAQRSNIKEVIQNMPNWIPGKLNKEVKRVQITIPLGLHFE